MILIHFFCVMIHFVKTMVLNDVNKMGQQVQIHLIFLKKPLKFLKAKLRILELHQNKFEDPQILKQCLEHYFPHVKPSK